MAGRLMKWLAVLLILLLPVRALAGDVATGVRTGQGRSVADVVVTLAALSTVVVVPRDGLARAGVVAELRAPPEHRRLY
ncbi:MAG: hypothetical protein ACHP7N_10670 [Caulobacterales bacterium]